MSKDISDLYIKKKTDPAFDDTRVENTTFLDTVVAKIYMILLTNKGDVLGNYDFGADVAKYLWKTKFPSSTIQSNIQQQFAQYIPELASTDYSVKVYILPGSTHADIGVVEVNLGVSTVNVLFK